MRKIYHAAVSDFTHELSKSGKEGRYDRLPLNLINAARDERRR